MFLKENAMKKVLTGFLFGLSVSFVLAFTPTTRTETRGTWNQTISLTEGQSWDCNAAGRRLEIYTVPSNKKSKIYFDVHVFEENE